MCFSLNNIIYVYRHIFFNIQKIKSDEDNDRKGMVGVRIEWVGEVSYKPKDFFVFHVVVLSNGVYFILFSKLCLVFFIHRECLFFEFLLFSLSFSFKIPFFHSLLSILEPFFALYSLLSLIFVSE